MSNNRDATARVLPGSSAANKGLAALLAVGIMASGGAAASAVLDEDFDSVSGITSNTSVRTVANIIANDPSQLQGSPVTSISTTGSTPPPATNAAFNVRRADNDIDGTSGSPTLGNRNFDNFFTGTSNQFLVIGDNSGDLAGAPDGGGSAGQSATMSMRFDLGASSFGGADWYRLGISFDYVFDASVTTNPDGFVVQLLLADLSPISPSLINRSPPTANTRGTFFGLIDLGKLTASPRYLNFRLRELPINGSAAVGLDNLLVQRIPEPGVLALFGAGLVGLLRLRRRAA